MPDFTEDYWALRKDAGAVWLPRDFLKVSGPDTVTFLQGQLSQDVEQLGVGTSALSFLLQPQGKVDALVRVNRVEDQVVVLDTDAGWGDAVKARLERFKLRIKAEVEPLAWRCLAVRGPSAHRLAGGVDADWPGLGGVDVVGDDPVVPDGIRLCDLAAYEAVRIEAGVPVMGREVDDKTIPAETGVVDRAVSFTKGCFTGQELVARIDSRGGNVPRHLRGVVVGTDVVPPAGARRRTSTRSLMRRAVAVVVVTLIAGAALAACSKKGGYDFPPPPSTIPDEQTTVPDFSTVQLARVSGRTTTTIDNTPGQAHISGFVVAPQGAVPGATVHAERLVGDAVLALDVATNPDGSFHLDNVQGGRYRLRAWRAPDLALTTPVIFFLNGNENKTGLNLQVSQYTGTNVAAVIAPNPPAVGDPANLAVQVTSVVVDPTGTVRATPMVGVEVDLQGAGSWQLQSASAEFTDSFGQATWRLTCTSIGVQPLSATVNTASYPLNVPACQEPVDTSPSPGSPSTTSATPTTARRTTTTG